MSSALDFHNKVRAVYMVTGVEGLQFHFGESEDFARLLRLLHESLEKHLPLDFLTFQAASAAVDPDPASAAGPSRIPTSTRPKTPELSEDIVDTIDGVPIPRRTPTPSTINDDDEFEYPEANSSKKGKERARRRR